MALSSGMVGGSYGPGGSYKPKSKTKPKAKSKPITGATSRNRNVLPYSGTATKPPPGPPAKYGGSAPDTARGAKTLGPKRPIVTQKDIATPYGSPAKARSAGKESVKQMQRDLNKQGARLAVDGIWGPKTQAAYNQYNKHITPAKPKTLSKKPAPKALAPRKPTGGGKPAGGGKGGKGGKPGGGGGALAGFAAPKTTSAVSSKAQEQSDLKRAKSSVEMVLNPMLNELKRQATTLRSSYDRMSTDEKARAERQQEDLREIYGRLGQYITNQKSGTDKVWEDARRNVKDAYAHLDHALHEDYGKSRSNVESETARLGIGAVNASANAGNERDEKFLRGLTSINATNADRGIASRRDAYDALQGLLGSEARVEGGSRQAEATRVSGKRLSDIAFEKTNKVGDLTGKWHDLAGTKGERVKQAMDAIKNARDEKEAEQAQQEFMNYITGQKLGLETRKVNLAETTAKQSAVRADKKLAADEAYHKAQLKISKTNAETSRIRATQAATKQAKVPSYKASGSYIEQNLGKGSKRTRDVQSIFNLVLAQDNGKLAKSKNNNGYIHTGTGVKLLPYDVNENNLGAMMAAGKAWLRDNHYGAAEEKVLYNALLRYFGKF